MNNMITRINKSELNKTFHAVEIDNIKFLYVTNDLQEMATIRSLIKYNVVMKYFYNIDWDYIIKNFDKKIILPANDLIESYKIKQIFN